MFFTDLYLDKKTRENINMFKQNKLKFTKFTKYRFLWIIFLFLFLPLYFWINVFLKNNQLFTRNLLFSKESLYWENFVFNGQMDNISNTTFDVLATIFVLVVIAVLGAFFFARYKISGSKILFFMFILLITYMGVVLNMAPSFKQIFSIGLYNPHRILIVTGIAIVQACTIYVLRNLIRDIPHDFFDAIEIDGGNVIHQIWHVVLPKSMPIIWILAILQIISICYIYEIINYSQ